MNLTGTSDDTESMEQKYYRRDTDMANRAMTPASGRAAYYIAEIGLNHNGNIDAALEMIRAAASSGADAVKFQTIVPEKLNSVYTTSLLQSGNDSNRDSSQIDFFSKFSLNLSEYRVIKDEAVRCGLDFISSVFDAASLDMLTELGVPFHKLASSELSNPELVRAAARSGLPLLLSTGMSSEQDIELALNQWESNGGGEIVLLHCVSLYPCSPEDLNLSRIRTLRERFGKRVGFSDHSAGIEAAFAAAAIGAEVFEKHFKLSSGFECPDACVSAAPDEFGRLVDAVEKAALMSGDGALSCGTREGEVARAARRSLFAAADIPKWKKIESSDLAALRPGVGIPANRDDLVIGKVANRLIEKERIIKMEYLD